MSSGKKAATQQASQIIVKLFIGAGQAAPTPPIGPALGQRGVKAIDFCKQFNASTANLIPGTPMRTFITVNPDRTFTYVVRPPMSSWFLKKAAGVEKGCHEPGREAPVGQISVKQIYEIAKIKKEDPELQHKPLERICKLLVGSCKSIGIKVVP